MKLPSLRIITSTLIIVGALSATPASAALSTAGVCPNVIGFGGTAADCNFLITFNADGSITTEFGATSTYDGVEDALVGVVNKTGSSIGSFGLSGSNIFGFDGDGINAYTGLTNAAAGLSSGPGTAFGEGDQYGGIEAYFTTTDLNTGIVSFLNGISGNGGTAYFSLEEPISITNAPTITPPTGSTVPEPASLALLGLGLASLGAARRKCTA